MCMYVVIPYTGTRVPGTRALHTRAITVTCTRVIRLCTIITVCEYGAAAAYVGDYFSRFRPTGGENTYRGRYNNNNTPNDIVTDNDVLNVVTLSRRCFRAWPMILLSDVVFGKYPCRMQWWCGRTSESQLSVLLWYSTVHPYCVIESPRYDETFRDFFNWRI